MPAATLCADDGTALAHYELQQQGDVQWVSVVGTSGDPTAIADALVRQFPGARAVVSEPSLITALCDRGGRIQRSGADYVCDVGARVERPAPLPAGYRLAPVSASAELAIAYEAAFPQGHPDHAPGLDRALHLRRILAGEVLGPLLDLASAAVHSDAGAVGAVLVTLKTPELPWVTELFVHPQHARRGVGRALLEHAFGGVRRAGQSLLGLVVSEQNRAERLYRAVGFELVLRGANVDLPLR